MSAFLFGYEPRYRAISATGAPIPGAKLRFYLSSTTTLTDTYPDEDLDPMTTNANPVVADSGGLFGPIYLDGSISYRVQLLTSANVLVWDQDPYTQEMLTQADIGAILYPQTEAEDSAGVTPVNYAYLDVRRMGVTGDGTTDDTVALQKCYTVGGAWEIPSGFHIRTTATITKRIATRLYTNGPRSPGPDGITQAFLIHDFDGTMFDLVGDDTHGEYNNGTMFEGLTFIQNHGNGSGASGVCIRNVAIDDTQRCAWTRIVDCHFETVTGKNDWTWGLVIDGVANSSSGTQNRDHFIDGCRFVSGSNATGSVWLNGVKNVQISRTFGNLANAILRITGTSSRTSGAVQLTATSFATIEIDYALGVYGDGNTSGTVTTSANTLAVDLGCSCTAGDPTIAAAGTTIRGIDAAGIFTTWSANTIRYEIGANDLQSSGPIVGEARVQGTMLRATDVATGAAGTVTFGDGSQSTVGAAGGASALPATPTGYMRFFLGTTEYVVPYYAQA